MSPRGSEFTVDASSGDRVVLQRPAALRELNGLRAALREWLSDHAIAGELADEQLVVLSELVTNAVEGSPPSASISVCWAVERDDLCISVEDAGLGFAYEAAEPVGSSALRGRGLTIVEALTDRVSVTVQAQRTTVAAWTQLRRSGK